MQNSAQSMSVNDWLESPPKLDRPIMWCWLRVHLNWISAVPLDSWVEMAPAFQPLATFPLESAPFVPAMEFLTCFHATCSAQGVGAGVGLGVGALVGEGVGFGGDFALEEDAV